MKRIMIIMFIGLFLLTGCARTFVCYDGTEQKIKSNCPIIPRAELTEQEASKTMDNYGNAMAQARGDTYTKVNLYQQNATWYSNVLFINKQSQTAKQVSFKIDGKTGNVQCQTGCDYVDFEK